MDAKTLCDKAGITYRQLDHWCTKGYLHPIGNENPGKGTNRDFTLRMMKKAEQMKCLTLLGFEPWQASRIAEAYVFQDAKHLHLGHGITVHVEPHNHAAGK